MKKLDKQNQSGFTIIEVVLVLAIAGLIFLVVFLALPQLQRSRRDTARRDQVGRILASLTQNASNSGGNFPADNTEFVDFVTDNNYFGSDGDCDTSGSPASPYECESFSDPSTGGITVATADGNAPAVGEVKYSPNAICDANTLDIDASAHGDRQVAVAMGLEQGGSYCQDNSD